MPALSPHLFLFPKIRITMRKILLLVATNSYVSVNIIYIVSLSIKGEVQTASKIKFLLKVVVIDKEKMKKLYHSIFIKIMVIKQTHLFES